MKTYIYCIITALGLLYHTPYIFSFTAEETYQRLSDFPPHGHCLESPCDQRKALIAAYLLHSGDTVLDVGASVGNYSLFYASLVSNFGKVIAFEPNPYAYHYFLDRLNSNSQTNIFVLEKAASNFSGNLVPMQIYADPYAVSSTLEPQLMNSSRMPGQTKKISVETFRLDDLKREDLLSLKLIKIDTEGHEHAVIEGAEGILTNVRPFLILEYGFILEEFEPNTIAQLEALEYDCYDLASMEKVYPLYEVPCTDLFALPREKTEEIAPLLEILRL